MSDEYKKGYVAAWQEVKEILDTEHPDAPNVQHAPSPDGLRAFIEDMRDAIQEG